MSALGDAHGSGLRRAAGPWLRPLTVFAVTATLAWMFIHLPGRYPDFTVLWAAAHHAFEPVYDPAFITTAQATPKPGLRPWAYPPTFLLLLLPLAGLKLAPAFALWVGVSAAAFVEATGRLVRRAPALVLISPHVLWVAWLGQSTLLVGALLVAGMALLSRPLLAGMLFGVAFSIKPTLALLLPPALLLAGQWRALGAMGATGLGLMAVTTAVFGPVIWHDWLAAMPQFLTINADLGIVRLAPPGVAAKLLVAVVGLGLTWAAFRTDDIARRIMAVLGASLLCSPHAAWYEVAILAPAALAMFWRWGWRTVPAGLFLLGYVGGAWTLPPFVLAMAARWPGEPELPVPRILREMRVDWRRWRTGGA